MKYKNKFVYKVNIYDRRSGWQYTLETLDNWRTAFEHAEEWNVSHGYGRFDNKKVGTGNRYAEVKEVEIHV